VGCWQQQVGSFPREFSLGPSHSTVSERRPDQGGSTRTDRKQGSRRGVGSMPSENRSTNGNPSVSFKFVKLHRAGLTNAQRRLLARRTNRAFWDDPQTARMNNVYKPGEAPQTQNLLPNSHPLHYRDPTAPRQYYSAFFQANEGEGTPAHDQCHKVELNYPSLTRLLNDRRLLFFELIHGPSLQPRTPEEQSLQDQSLAREVAELNPSKLSNGVASTWIKPVGASAALERTQSEWSQLPPANSSSSNNQSEAQGAETPEYAQADQSSMQATGEDLHVPEILKRYERAFYAQQVLAQRALAMADMYHSLRAKSPETVGVSKPISSAQPQNQPIMEFVTQDADKASYEVPHSASEWEWSQWVENGDLQLSPNRLNALSLVWNSEAEVRAMVLGEALRNYRPELITNPRELTIESKAGEPLPYHPLLAPLPASLLTSSTSAASAGSSNASASTSASSASTTPTASSGVNPATDTSRVTQIEKRLTVVAQTAMRVLPAALLYDANRHVGIHSEFLESLPSPSKYALPAAANIVDTLSRSAAQQAKAGAKKIDDAALQTRAQAFLTQSKNEYPIEQLPPPMRAELLYGSSIDGVGTVQRTSAVGRWTPALSLYTLEAWRPKTSASEVSPAAIPMDPEHSAFMRPMPLAQLNKIVELWEDLFTAEGELAKALGERPQPWLLEILDPHERARLLNSWTVQDQRRQQKRMTTVPIDVGGGLARGKDVDQVGPDGTRRVRTPEDIARQAHRRRTRLLGLTLQDREYSTFARGYSTRAAAKERFF